MKVTVKFEGGAELAANLAELSTRVQKTILLKALTAGAQPIRSSAASHAPRSEEAPHVGDHIVVGSVRQKGTGASVAIGPSRDFEERANIYPALQEIGTVHHEPQPFMRPAFDGQGHQALSVIRQDIWFGLISRGVGSTRAGGGGGLG